MKLKAARIAFGVGVLLLLFVIANPLRAQMAAATLSGTITDSSGRVVADATISVKNVGTGQSIGTQTNLAGVYDVPNLVPGGYTVSVSAGGFDPKVAKVTLTGAKGQTVDLVLNASPAQQKIPANKSPATPPANLPNAPSSTTTPLSLQSLGFAPSQTQANTQLQARLDKRTHMLKVHQTLGLITAIPMMAALITGPQAKAEGENGKTITEPTAANLDFHIALGGLTTGLYWTTAYYAIFAPKIPGVKPKGAIRLHRDLEWVHGPGMILTPILGILAYKQENAGEKVHGIASAHGTVAYVTAIAYGASIIAVSWPIHLKFWERR